MSDDIGDEDLEIPVDMMLTFEQTFTIPRLLDASIVASNVTVKFNIDPFHHEETKEAFITARKRFVYWVEKVLSQSFALNLFSKESYEMVFDDDGISRIKQPLLFSPMTPTDEVLGWLLMAKLNAFGDEKMICESVEIKSLDTAFTLYGDPLEVLPSQEEWMDDQVTHFGTPWWTRNDSSTLDIPLGSDYVGVPEPPYWAYDIDERINQSEKRIESVKPTFNVVTLDKK